MEDGPIAERCPFLWSSPGVKALKTAVRYASNQGIAVLTVYAFSTENWTNPKMKSSS